MRQVVADSRDHTIEGLRYLKRGAVLLAAIAIPLIAIGVNEV
jgi:hypothetical protein